MKKIDYLKIRTNLSIKFLRQLSKINIINDLKNYINKDFDNSEVISYIGLPFMFFDYINLDKKFKSKNKKELNKKITKRIKHIGKFDYNLWREDKGLDKILLKFDFKNNIFYDQIIDKIDIVEDLKKYRGNKYIEKYFINFKNEQIVYTFGKLGYSCCVEFPILGMSYVFFDDSLSTLEGLFNFIHEIGHSVHNSFKYSNNKFSIEDDETMAYFIQYELIKTIFPKYKEKFLLHLYDLYKSVCVKYEFEKYLYEFRTYSFKSRTSVFRKILKKHGFSEQYQETWIYDNDYWNNPFYSGVYVKALETLFINNFDLSYVMP